jgi:hypothetical protein
MIVNAPVATVLGSIPASVGTVESEGRQMKQCKKKSPKKILKKKYIYSPFKANFHINSLLDFSFYFLE